MGGPDLPRGSSAAPVLYQTICVIAGARWFGTTTTCSPVREQGDGFGAESLRAGRPRRACDASSARRIRGTRHRQGPPSRLRDGRCPASRRGKSRCGQWTDPFKGRRLAFLGGGRRVSLPLEPSSFCARLCSATCWGSIGLRAARDTTAPGNSARGDFQAGGRLPGSPGPAVSMTRRALSAAVISCGRAAPGWGGRRSNSGGTVNGARDSTANSSGPTPVQAEHSAENRCSRGAAGFGQQEPSHRK